MEMNKEREYESELNQSRSRINKKTKEYTPGTVINFAEFIIIIGAAITVDSIDALDLTGFGAIFVRFIDIPTLGALWLWRVLKHQPGMKKDPTFQILLAFLVEISPFGMIPSWTIFVFYVYLKDNKLAKKTVGSIKKIKRK